MCPECDGFLKIFLTLERPGEREMISRQDREQTMIFWAGLILLSCLLQCDWITQGYIYSEPMDITQAACTFCARVMPVNLIIYKSIHQKVKVKLTELCCIKGIFSQRRRETYLLHMLKTVNNLLPSYFSCGPNIVKQMRRNLFRVKQVVFESRCLK